MKSTRKIAYLTLLLPVFLFGCSTRQVYQSSTNTTPISPSAININTATADELEKLPHIGRKTAEAIIQFRNLNGSFRRPEHLMQIRGISEKRFLEMRQFLRSE